MQGSPVAAVPIQSMQTQMLPCSLPPGLRQAKLSPTSSIHYEDLDQCNSAVSSPSRAAFPRPPPGLFRQQPDGLADATPAAPPARQSSQAKRHITLNFAANDSDSPEQDLYKAAPGPQANYPALQALHASPTGKSKQAGLTELAEGQVLCLCLQYMLTI